MKTILIDALHAFVIKGVGVFEEMYQLLEQYPHQKIILTNAHQEEMTQLGLTDLPYRLFTLEHHPDKTDPEYFRIVLQYFNLQPGQVIYFEHNKDAVKSARQVGISTFYYDPEQKDLVALKKFIDQNT